MAHGQVTTNVPAELKSAAVGGVVASAEGIFDYNENKTQEQLNQDLKKAIEDIDVTDQIGSKLDKTEAANLYQPKGNYLTEHQDISGKANITDVYTKQQVDTALGNKQDTLADSEDVVKVTKENGVALNFANKTYNSATFSGLGKTYLRKNIVTIEGVEKNVLTQAMVNTANTIYHIQYDFDLSGETITLPAGCVLEFNGGKIINGTLVGNVTYVKGNILFKNIKFDGTFYCDKLISYYFEDATGEIIESVLNHFSNTDFYIEESQDWKDVIIAVDNSKPYLHIHGNGNNVIIDRFRCLRELRIDHINLDTYRGAGTYNYCIDCRHGLVMDHCNITNVVMGGVLCESAYKVSIVDSVIVGTYTTGDVTSMRSGIRLLGTDFKECLVRGNKITNIEGKGIYVSGLVQEAYVEITDNTIEHVAAGGIMLDTSHARRVSISRNSLYEIDLSYITSATSRTADYAGINIHGSQGFLCNNNTITKCYGYSIDIEGSDNDYYANYIEEHPSATHEEKSLAYQNKGKNGIVEGNIIQESLGILVSSCYNVSVLRNNLEEVYTQEIKRGAIGIYNSTEITIDGNFVNLYPYTDYVSGTHNNSYPITLRYESDSVNQSTAQIENPIVITNNTLVDNVGVSNSINVPSDSVIDALLVRMRGNVFKNTSKIKGYYKITNVSKLYHIVNEDVVKVMFQRISLNVGGSESGLMLRIPYSESMYMKQVNIYSGTDVLTACTLRVVHYKTDSTTETDTIINNTSIAMGKTSIIPTYGFQCGNGTMSYFILTSAYGNNDKFIDIEFEFESKSFHRYF